MLEITVAFSTINDRIFSIKPQNLKQTIGINYLIVLQLSKSRINDLAINQYISEFNIRSDIQIVVLSGQGVTKSRNHAIKIAKGDILLFCDDDISLNFNIFPILRDYYVRHPTASFLCGQLVNKFNQPLKKYCNGTTPATWYNSGKVGTPELSILLKKIRTAEVFFDESFGAGTENYIGDEYIFLNDCLNKNLTGFHIPLVFGAHNSNHSSGAFFGGSDLIIRRRILDRALTKNKIFVRILFLLKHRKDLKSFKSVIGFLFSKDP